MTVRRALLCGSIAIGMMGVCAVSSWAAPLSSQELIERATAFNEKKVAYRGEAITAVLRRGEYAWVNLSDGVNAIGIWCTATDAASISSVGSYGRRGDAVEVEGVFHRACAQHGGELDIHADTFTIIKPGCPRMEPIEKWRADFACALLLVLFLVTILCRKKIAAR